MSRSILASALIVSALAAPAFAQGNSQGKGKGNGHASSPPSRNVLAAPTAIVAAPSNGAAPFAWVDDATILDAGAGSVGFSIVHFQGADVAETDAPVVEASLGLAPRVQLAVTVPRVIAGADEGAAAGGVGTTFVAAKVAVLDNPKRHFKIAVTPTVEILGAAVAASLNEGESRTQFGLPVSAEVDGGSLRVYGSTGFFTSGVRFVGAGAAVQASPKAILSLGISHSWRSDDLAAAADRSELSGGLGLIVTPRVVVFGSIGRTIGTLDENGAGTTVNGGVSFSFTAPTR
jgi:hypothetical protein